MKAASLEHAQPKHKCLLQQNPAVRGAMGADLRATGSVGHHPAGSALLVLLCAGGGCLGWLQWQGRGHMQQRRHPPAAAPRGEWHEVTEGPAGLPGLSQQGASPSGDATHLA